MQQLQQSAAAPLLCRLGIPTNSSTPDGSGGSGGAGSSSNGSSSSDSADGGGSSTRKHKLAVLIPYRDRCDIHAAHDRQA